MTRLFTDGGETGDLSFWSTPGAGYVSVANKRSGNYGYGIAGTDVGQSKTFTGITELYLRCAVRLNNVAGGIFNILFRNSTTTVQTLSIAASTSLITLAGVSSAPFTVTLGQWYLIEVYLKIADAGGRADVLVDGVLRNTFTGDTKPGAATTIDNIVFTKGGADPFFFDDVAVNDTNGAVDNSWCGDGRIIALVPNAVGSSSQWLNSSGSSTNNYQYVDEVPPSDTDYVRATGSGYVDDYNLSTFDFAGQSIARIWLVDRGKSDTSGDYFMHGIQVSGTNYLVTGSLATSFSRIDISASGTWPLNPFTSNVWSQAEIDALKVVIQSP